MPMTTRYHLDGPFAFSHSSEEGGRNGQHPVFFKVMETVSEGPCGPDGSPCLCVVADLYLSREDALKVMAAMEPMNLF